MSDKTEDQIAREREAIEAMKNARANMDRALARNETLQYALNAAKSDLQRVKGWLPVDSYLYESRISQRGAVDDMIAKIQKVL